MLDCFFFFPVVSIACEEDDDDEALTLALAAFRSPNRGSLFLSAPSICRHSREHDSDPQIGAMAQSDSGRTHSFPG